MTATRLHFRVARAYDSTLEMVGKVMKSRATILVKGMVLIAVPLFFQLVFIGLVARMRLENIDAETWAIHTKDVIAQAGRCRVMILSAHGAIQGLILTRDPSFDENLVHLAAQARQELEQFMILVSDRGEQVRQASKIQRDALELLHFMSEGQELVHEGKMDPKRAAERRRRSQDFLSQVEADLDGFLNLERQLDDERRERLARGWATFEKVLIGGVAISLLFSLSMASLFARNISGRISTLTENARRLAESKELSPRMEGEDEIAKLDQVFHEMAQTLSEAARREKIHSGLLEHRADELASVNMQLREKAQENEMFVYSVSHDLRSPLVNLQGFSKELQLIGRDLQRLVTHEQIPPQIRQQALTLIETDMGESIGFIQSAVTRLSSIIDALLRLSRAGRVEYRRQRVAVKPLVERVVAALRGTIDQQKATITIGNLAPAWGDPTALEQVFANLIGNAVNYLDPAKPGVIEIFSVENDKPDLPGLVIYGVRDNGLGIDEQYNDKVFSAFQRLHGDVAKGEGVGLALVRRMVERHGGRVWFESKVGIGTTFYVGFLANEAELCMTPSETDSASSLATVGS